MCEAGAPAICVVINDAGLAVKPFALSSHSQLGSHGLDGLRSGVPGRDLVAEGQGEECRFTGCSGFSGQISCGGDYTSGA